MSSMSQLDRTYAYIREQIEGGMIRPGHRISRRLLAEEIGVSPALVQQALVQLEREGIVETRPRSGTYVRELLAEEYSNLCDIRELLEPYAAARAAERITDEEIHLLRESCRRYHQLADTFPVPKNAAAAWLRHCQADQEEVVFHGIILKAAGNPMLAQLMSTLRLLSHVSPQLVYSRARSNENDLTVVAFEHEGIVEAIAARNPDLAQARMLNHLRGARVIIEQVEMDREVDQKLPGTLG